MSDKTVDILKNCLNVPRNAEHISLIIYKGWNAGKIQRARFQYILDNKIISYFLHMCEKQIKIFNPTNNTNTCDSTIDF